MRLTQAITTSGHVRIYAHDPSYQYSRDTYRRGQVLHDHHNAIQAVGLTYIAQMLMADPVNDPQKYGITQIGVKSTAGSEVHKADLTDQYVSGTDVINVLYLTSAQPASQPVDLDGATLYLDDGGLTQLATASFSTISKTSLLAVTFEWMLSLTGS
jgi:hypothetical protein